MSDIRQDLIAAAIGLGPRRGIAGGSIYNALNQWIVRDDELIAFKALLTGNEFSEPFWSIESDCPLIWNKEKDAFISLKDGEEYFMRLFYDQFDDTVQSALDWTFLNSTVSVNDWAFGIDSIDPAKTNGMYISNDAGVTNAYTANDAGISHSTLDVLIPASANRVRIKSKIKSNGEPGSDDLRLFAYNVPTVPTQDVAQGPANLEAIIIGEIPFKDIEFELDNSFTGATISLSLQWRNNASVNRPPPGHIAEFEVAIK